MTEHSLPPRILTIIMLVLIVLLVIIDEQSLIRNREFDPAELIGTKLPPLSVKALSGKEIFLPGLQRQSGLLIFFSTSCAYCREELQFWNSMGRELNQSLEIRCISVNTAEETTAFLSEQSIELPAYTADHKAVRDRFRINRVPSLFVVDKEGTIKAYFAGSVNKERIIEQVKEILYEQSGSRNEY